MPKCQHYKFCGLHDEADHEAGLCILHSQNPNKAQRVFAEALTEHSKQRGDDFTSMIFPGEDDFFQAKFSTKAIFHKATFAKSADFTDAEFVENVDFVETTFCKKAYFNGATFYKKAVFLKAMFTEEVDFRGARFTKEASFLWMTFPQFVSFTGARFSASTTFAGTEFSQEAHFDKATFAKRVDFAKTRFSQEADFGEATFAQEANFAGAWFSSGADFRKTRFAGTKVSFHSSRFHGTTLFTSRQDENQAVPIFRGVQEVDFTGVVIDPPNAVTFTEADLTRCRLLDTDLHKIQMIGVEWPQIRRWLWRRPCVYDEKLLQKEAHPWSRVERLYRQLKQNLEDQRDYERAGHFHYGEKEIRRRDPDTSWKLWVLLWLYRLVSGYGERLIPPILSASVLLIGSTCLYLVLGLQPAKNNLAPVLAWADALVYSLQVMTFFKPQDYVLSGLAKAVYTFESLLGPLVLGLFALAVRQRLKR